MRQAGRPPLQSKWTSLLTVSRFEARSLPLAEICASAMFSGPIKQLSIEVNSNQRIERKQICSCVSLKEKVTSPCGHENKAVQPRQGGVQGLPLVQPEVPTAKEVSQQVVCLVRPGEVPLPPPVLGAIQLLACGSSHINRPPSFPQAAPSQANNPQGRVQDVTCGSLRPCVSLSFSIHIIWYRCTDLSSRAAATQNLCMK